MAWDAQRVTNVLESEGSVPKYMRKYVEGFVAVIALFEKVGTISETDVVLAIANSEEVGDNPDALRNMFCAELADTSNIDVPKGALQVPFIPASITPDAPPGLPQHVIDPLRRIQAMRTPERTRRGLRLAAAARSLLGNWRWVQRAPDSILPYRHVRENTTGFTDIRAFDIWVKQGGAIPMGTVALNCREAVLATARHAGLLTHGQLRAAYLDAERAGLKVLGPTMLELQRTVPRNFSQESVQLGSSAYVAYLKCLDDRLNALLRAEPVNLKYGLIPHSGDLVFVRGAPPEHVCISLGATWVNGKAVHWVASLWTQDGGRFSRQKLKHMAHESRLLFVPCPF